jgi:hypothetical protein
MRLGKLAVVGLMGLAAGGVALAAPASPFPVGYGAAYKAYLAALPPKGRAMSWLAKLDGVGSAPRPLTMGGQTVVYLFGCKPHDCQSNNVNVFLLPDRKTVRAVVKIRDVQTSIGGAGPAELACVKTLDASGGVAPAC